MKVIVGKEDVYYISSLCITALFPVWINGKWFKWILKENKYPECSSQFFAFLLKNALQKIKMSIIFLACQL